MGGVGHGREATEAGVSRVKQSPRSARALLESPLIIACLVLWGVNDHVLKPALSNVLTGKLSDVACLIVIPVLFGATAELFAFQARETARRRIGAVVLLSSAALSCLTMALINTWPPAAHVYELGLGGLQWPFRTLFSLIASGHAASFRPVLLTMDSSDLWTCPASMVPVYLMLRRART